MTATDPVVAMWRRYEALLAAYDSLPDDEAEAVNQAAAADEWSDIADRIVETPAPSLAGAVAKLRLLRLHQDVHEIGDDWHKQLLDSAIADLERLGGGVS